MIRPARPADAVAVAAIYNHFVEHSVVTFATEPEPVSALAADIEAAGASLPYLVWEDGGAVRGYALASGWKSRCAYRFAVETSVYLAPGAEGRGVGTRLYGELLDQVAAAGHHCALGGIALPNPASVALHEKLGFVQVGLLKEVGRKFDTWIDVGYWQLMLSGG